MRQIILGKTGISVSELCFGALPMGPVQKNVPVEEGGEVIAAALRGGVTFIDTAQMYKTYPHIRHAMDLTGITPVISTKSAAETYADMDKAVQEALTGLKLPVIDIFLLHAARVGGDVFERRSGALQCLLDYKAKGVIKAVGISAHAVDVVNLAASRDDIDVVFPIINTLGLGILNGSRDEMEAAIHTCFKNGKAVFLMKALAGGKLITDYKAAMDYARALSGGRAAIALGMVNQHEVTMNLRYFNDADITSDLSNMHENVKRFYALKLLCAGCGKCVEACHSGAVRIDSDGKAVIDDDACLTCGYCVDACPSFCIRMI